MRIIHVLNHFLPTHIAGTEVYVWSLCKEQQKSNHAVTVLIPNYKSTKEDVYFYDDIEVYKYPEPSVADRSLITGQRKPKGLEAFVSYLRHEKPDIVHFHEIAGSNGITVAHFEAAKATGAKIIFTMHLASATCRAGTLMLKTKKLCDGLIIEERCAYCTLIHRTHSAIKAIALTKAGMALSTFGIDPIKWQNPIGTALSYPNQIRKLKRDLNSIVANCDKVITLTNWYYDIVLKNGVPRGKIKIIYQALPVIPSSATTNKTGGLPIRLIFVGRIDPLKGLNLLAEVIKQFAPDQLQLDIYGATIDDSYEMEIKKRTLSVKNLRWMGKLNREEVVPTMRNYDALILPSMFSEMSPLVVQEAFAACIPVIGSNVYGIAEQVQEGVNGMLFQFGDALALKKTLQKLIDNPKLLNKLSENIKPVDGFKRVADETESVYKSVLAV